MNETDKYNDADYARWVWMLDEEPERDLPNKDVAFIGDLIRRRTKEFSNAQRAWILDLVERFL